MVLIVFSIASNTIKSVLGFVTAIA
jgi:hypothetical protein